jgi:hypothetical protein
VAGARGDVVRVGDDAGNDDDERVVAAHGRNRFEHVIGERRLTTRALRVDDRRFTVTVTVSCKRADAHVGIDRCGERPGQFDAFTLECAEAGQGERDFVDARTEIFDPVLTGAIADRAANLFDQGGATGFDSDTGEHGPRGVLHETGDNRLRMSNDGDEGDANQHAQDFDGCTHEAPSQSVSDPARRKTRRAHYPLPV